MTTLLSRTGACLAVALLVVTVAAFTAQAFDGDDKLSAYTPGYGYGCYHHDYYSYDKPYRTYGYHNSDTRCYPSDRYYSNTFEDRCYPSGRYYSNYDTTFVMTDGRMVNRTQFDEPRYTDTRTTYNDRRMSDDEHHMNYDKSNSNYGNTRWDDDGMNKDYDKPRTDYTKPRSTYDRQRSMPSTARTRTAGFPNFEDALDIAVYDVNGEPHVLRDHLDNGEYVVLEWFNPECAYSKRYFSDDNNRISSRDDALAFARDNDVVWLMVNSNAVGTLGGGYERNIRAIEDYSIDVPLLLDENGQWGRAFNVATTPHVVLLSPDREILYNGTFDDTVLITDNPRENFVVSALSDAMGFTTRPVLATQPGCAVSYAQVIDPEL